MRKYKEELVATYVDRELGKFVHENNSKLATTVGETILIIQTTTDFINDLLQGTPSKEQRSMVVDETMDFVKKLMFKKQGLQYEENEVGEENPKSNRRAR